ncbi:MULTISPECIES: nuclear transport factor 2 family protein [Nocardioides]|uniref:Nuclear transport factor 2 family protein n=1 Tax=Nocardioides vastitatis TaxID=2568655 RepID=A0ABW0ZCJ6_9ACTN|nr:nuclear transport factor 2 family protein [Nocardioides sp.]THJ15102.1 6-phosphogluconate dehydrogenase [Nocardioides sp.]
MSHQTSVPPARVAVLGLGRLGAACATRLASRGHEVVGWSRSGRAVPGVALADTAAEAVAGARCVLLCLYDGDACREVLGLVGDRLAHETTVVNMSTVGTDDAVALEKEVQASGARYAHAPVIGSVSAVAAGRLAILLGGTDDTMVRGVLDDLGDVLACGGVGRAAAAKLLANGVLGGALLAIRDSRLRAEQLELEAERAWSVLERTALGGLVSGKRSRLESGDLGQAEFTVGALAKDLELLAAEAPVAAGLRDSFAATVREGAIAVESDIAALCLAGRGSDQALRPHGLTVAPHVAEPPEVLAPLEAYVAGHATGNPDHHRRAFLPTAHVEGLRDEHLVSWTVEEYCALFSGTPAPDEASRRRRIDHAAVSGSVGTASMTLWHGDSVFVDVFLLLLVDGEWRIANKAYHRRTRADGYRLTGHQVSGRELSPSS